MEERIEKAINSVSRYAGFVVFLSTLIVLLVDRIDLFGYYAETSDSPLYGLTIFVFVFFWSPIALLVVAALGGSIRRAEKKEKFDNIPSIRFIRCIIAILWIVLALSYIAGYTKW